MLRDREDRRWKNARADPCEWVTEAIQIASRPTAVALGTKLGLREILPGRRESFPGWSLLQLTMTYSYRQKRRFGNRRSLTLIRRKSIRPSLPSPIRSGA